MKKKYQNFLSEIFHFFFMVKSLVYLNRHVLIVKLLKTMDMYVLSYLKQVEMYDIQINCPSNLI